MPVKREIQPIKLNLLDKLVTVFRPQMALDRIRARAALNFLSSSGYITPGSHKRTMRGWAPDSGSADYDSIPKLDAIRQGSRDLVMNTPIASAPLNRELTNAVGWGLILQSRIDRESLNMTSEQASKWERNAEREFRLWSESKDCDAARTVNFYEQQAQILYNTSLSGDVFVLLPYIEKKSMPYELSVKIIEADMVCNPQATPDTDRIAGGIEVDENGAPIKYYFRKPDRTFLDAGIDSSMKWVAIEAFGAKSDRRNVLHLFHQKRPGQRRGIPMLAPVIETLKQISRLTEAELQASVINSFFTVFVKTNPVTGGFEAGYVPEESITATQNLAGDSKLYEMGSGNVVELPEGQDVSLADPKRPNESFEPFFMALVKQIGSCVDIPFEQMILHFQASYSAARAALLEAWKFYRTRRMWVSRNFCQPIYEEWLTEAVLKGRIQAPGFFDDPIIRASWCGAQWVGPGQGQIDPLKETRAATVRLNARLSDFETEYAQIHGGDWEKSMDRLAREQEYLKQRDISFLIPQEDKVIVSVPPAEFEDPPADKVDKPNEED